MMQVVAEPIMVTSPVLATFNTVVVAVPVVEAIANSGVLAAVLIELDTERRAYGEVVPTPTCPLPSITKRSLVPSAVEDEILNL